MNYFYPEDLPIVEKKDDIAKALLSHQVIIVAGDTGSGKTTQIPKICLETIDLKEKIIGCTQPRRIAATSVASRVAEELGSDENLVGYKIRFHDHTKKTTKIKFMTDGVLLAETRNDSLLKQYGVIILDEAHERSLNIDFLLGYLKKLLPARPDLKLIVTSATIDTQAFSKHFTNAPIIQVSGRTYPVEVKYLPLPDEENEEKAGYVEHCANTIDTILKNYPPGDILAFLPTEKDIRTCCDLLADQGNHASVLPLFGRLASHDQQKIFQRHNRTKIVVSTNVAETSLTVPGIRYVVDTGLARMSYYSGRSKTTSLPIRQISQASCDQRKGRCGRIGPGICFRLYSSEDYNTRDEYTLPEIKRSNLAEVILQMISLQLGSVEDFPFIDPPQKSAIRDGYKLLFELGAIGAQNRLTQVGKLMASLPIDPCIARILIEAQQEQCLKEVKIIASALAIQDPRTRPADKEKEADEAHKIFAHPHSDFMEYLNLWNHYHTTLAESWSWSKLKKYCQKHFLSFQRMREWFDLHEQLERLLQQQKSFIDNGQDSSYQQIHRSITSGFLRNIACKKQGNIYQNGMNRELMIFPGSHQFKSGGHWIIAGSFLETNRLYALTVATIESEWLEQLGHHLVKYSWTNPRWSVKTGQVLADEKVTLFGLIIVASRTVNFPKRSDNNIEAARQIFIQSALVEGNIGGNYRFLETNNNRIEKWKKEENKLRSGTIVNDDSVFFSFYDRNLPPHVYDRASLNRYLKRHGHKKLFMTDEAILNSRPDENELADYPNKLHAGSIDLSVEYIFSPGDEKDGMNIRIPLMSAETIPETFFEWLVPGLLREKITYLLKGLPKKLRRHLVPVNVAVDRILDDLNIYKGSLYHTMESSIHKLYSLQINRSDWPDHLPLHLTARFILIDNDGKEVSSGRNLGKLLSDNHSKTSRLHNRESNPSYKIPEEVEKWDGYSTNSWSFHDLPNRVPILNPQNQVIGFFYPYLAEIPNKGEVTVKFTTEAQTAADGNTAGLEYLYRLQFAQEFKALRKYLSSLLSGPSVKFLLSSGMKSEILKQQFTSCILKTLFPSIGNKLPSKETFQKDITRVKTAGFYKTGQHIADNAIQLIRKKYEVHQKMLHFYKLDKRKIVFNNQALEKFTNLLWDIVPGDYYSYHTGEDFESTLRQLRSLEIRIERYYANPAKDEDKMAQIQPYLTCAKQFAEKKAELTDEAFELLKRYNTLLAEFRISLFSPEIKTTEPVSHKKLKKLQQELLSKC